jgi:hypothetical protein
VSIQSKLAIDTVYSKNGKKFLTKGQFRFLTIYVNIIYDQTPDKDPCINKSTIYWKPDTTNSINTNPPTYLKDFLDVEYVPNKLKGTMSRIFGESSFENLVLLGDFMVVNIKQSKITPTKKGASFSISALSDSVISFINLQGGLKTLYNHNSISDYDFCSKKEMSPNGYIDYIQFMVRNITTNYGGNEIGCGTGYVTPTKGIKINNKLIIYDNGSYQGVGVGDVSLDYKCPSIHEFAHALFGDNEFHTSGGNHFGNEYINTFISLQCGFGLMGALNSTLTSCNAYERWRMDWRGPDNNLYPIAAGNRNTDITKFLGTKTFYLRDFVTYGDAIRIKLPYKQTNEASEQYIWLENHQIGKNNKLDLLTFSEDTCRKVNPGILSYIQVGKDVLKDVDYFKVFPENETDNLKIISAEGNYDIVYIDNYPDCPYKKDRSRLKYERENPLCGFNDQSAIIYNNRGTNEIDLKYDHYYLGVKYPYQNDLPYLGDKYDAFTNGSVIDISTNPAPVNAMTYYSYQYTNSGSIIFNPTTANRNTRKIYLTGLSIKMTEVDEDNSGKIFRVEIRWDDYNVKKDVLWAGDIVLKEKLFINPNIKVSLVQSRTPNQKFRNACSNEFADPTVFTCEANSESVINNSSSIVVSEKSTLILDSASTFTINDNATLSIKSGCNLIIKKGATVIIKGTGKIDIESGAFMCVKSGALITLQDKFSVINFHYGSVLGAITTCISVPGVCINSAAAISRTGNGSVNTFTSNDVYIQNRTYTTTNYITGNNIYIGSGVIPSSSVPQGPVIIKNPSSVVFDADGTIYFYPSFEAQPGSTFEAR